MSLITPTYAPRAQTSRRSRLPFHWNAQNGLVTTALTPQTGTFSRASTAPLATGRDGRLVGPRAQGIPAWEAWDHDGDGAFQTAGLNMDLARTNLVTTQDISAWTDSGSPTTTAVPSPYAGVSAYLIDDNDGATAEYKIRTVAFTGDAVKAIAIVMKKGTAAASTIVLRDTSAGADRLIATITWSGTDPGTPAVPTGTYLGKRELWNDFWLVLLQTASVTAANTNQLWLYATSSTGADTGSTYYALPTAANAPFLSNVLTASQAAVKPDLRFTFPFPVQALSFYLRFTEIGQIFAASTGILASICLNGTSTTDPRLSIYRASGGAGYEVSWDPGTETTATLAALPALHQSTELLVTLDTSGVATIYQSLAEAATTSAAASAQSLPATTTYFGNSQADARLVIGDIGASGTAPGALSLHACKVDWGVKTMAQMRVAF